ncbi:MAG TPA: hypothetical protein H9881_12910 [Candidatus Stackebrandtia excrementipullorum]|nr:hypothetical protein [Candidatus Stackebrandtia excrementipullorum]
MKGQTVDMWAGAAGTIVCAVVTLPAVIVGLQDDSDRLVPGWLWALLCLTFLVAQAASMWLWSLMSGRSAKLLFAVQVAVGPILFLTASTAGWIPIILVFTAAMSVHLVSLRVTASIIVLNTLTIGAGGWINYGALRLDSDQWTDVAVGALIYALLQVASALSVVGLLRETRMRRELAVAHAELAAASAMLAESSRTEERLRISRDLHDLIGHQLTVLTLELEVASHKATPEVAENVGRARQVARDLLADVRVAVGELRERAPQLRESIDRVVSSLPNLEVSVSVDDGIVADEDQASTFIRCVQEIVTNTIRHADATELSIVLTGDDDVVTLTAADDGLTNGEFEVGNGLRGLTERVEKLGGTTRIWTDNGFHVQATVPASRA